MNRPFNARVEITTQRLVFSFIVISIVAFPLFGVLSSLIDIWRGDGYVAYLKTFSLSYELSSRLWSGYLSALPYSVVASAMVTTMTYVCWKYLPSPAFFAPLLSVGLTVVMAFSLFFEEGLAIACFAINAWVVQLLSYGLSIKL
ncbi:MAG: hypothetical protein HWE20_15230 [Gammaproteobacteria bacterium]|nr:hypothetical protein [Gammaproteobacteria bacterium]